MENSEYFNMFKLEDSHWWFRGKRDIIKYILKNKINPNSEILDYGCGCGALLTELSKFYQVSGVDISDLAIDFCRSRGLRSVYNVNEWAWRQKKYDTIIMSDVLEHIEDDRGVVIKLFDMLKPGGFLLITVPANKFLWSKHDEHLHHVKRYTKKELSNLFLSCNITRDKVRIRYYNSFLFLPAFFVIMFNKLTRRRYKSNTTFSIPRVLNFILYKIFSSEKHWLNKNFSPCGLSLFCLVKKNK